ncbi:hypothetical protein B0H11DRAFT_1669014, partial [Mycena galericulata]
VGDLYFSSEPLVIRAENKIFKVTKSILAARSSVFKDMVAFPQPQSEDTEIIDGYAVLLLHDSAADVEVFLRAIFDSSYFMPPPAMVETRVVCGILRLAHKYDVEYLHLRALAHLSPRYAPDSVYKFREYQDLEDRSIMDRIEVIRAVTEVDAIWLLPVAYYLVSEDRPEHLRASVALGADPDIIGRCLAAHGRLSRATSAMNSFLSRKSDERCTSAVCDYYRFRQLVEYFDRIEMGVDYCPLYEWIDADWTWHNFCDHCLGVAREAHTAALEEFWDDLPSLYDLP